MKVAAKISWARVGMAAGVAYLAAHALTGRQSVPTVLDLAERQRTLEAELAALNKERLALAAQAERLHVDHLDRDYLEERARTLVAGAHPDEILIPAPELEP